MSVSSNSQQTFTEEELEQADLELALRKRQDPLGFNRADQAFRREFEQQKISARNWGETWTR